MIIKLSDAHKDGDYSTEYAFYWYPKILKFEEFVGDKKLVWFEFVELTWIHRWEKGGMGKTLESYRIIKFKDYWQAKFNKSKKNED